MNASKGEGSIQVLNKVAVLLDFLAEVGESTAAEIAGETGEPRSSIYRLLGSLQELGFVEPANRRASFRLGLKLLRLGSAVRDRFNERLAALSAMEALHELTGETTFLCVRRDWEAVCIDRLEGEHVQSLALRLGGSLPLHVGAAPRVLLAFEPKELWEKYVARGRLQALTPSTLVSKRPLFESLERMRARGYAISDQDVTPGIAAVGAPVFDYDGTIRAAISISGTRPMILDDERRSVNLVVEAANRASRSMGFTGTSAVDT